MLLRSGAAACARGRCPKAVFAAGPDARSAFAAVRAQAKSEGAFRSASFGQARWMSAAAPSSADGKKDEPKPELGAFSKFMSKENCVVSSSKKRRRSIEVRLSM